MLTLKLLFIEIDLSFSVLSIIVTLVVSGSGSRVTHHRFSTLYN